MSKFTKVSGVYKIVNQITGSFYIGSSKNIYTRMRSHLYLLRKNKHHSKVLQNQFNKYGESSLVMSPICFCDEPLLLILEQMYLDAMQPPCNTMTEVEASPMKGRTHPEEVLIKMRGKTPWNKNKPRTLEERLLMSEQRKLAYLRQSSQIKLKNRKRSSNYLKTHKPFKGKSHSDSYKQELRNFRIKGRKKILCHQNGKIYLAQNNIHKDLGLRQGHISEHLNGKRINVKGYTFEYLDELVEVESSFVSKKEEDWKEKKFLAKYFREKEPDERL